MISNFCPKCGMALCVCIFLGVPVIEAIDSPPKARCSVAQLCTERPLATEPWSPDAPEHYYRNTNRGMVELVAETGGDLTVPWGWSVVANGLPVGQRYRRGAASYQSDGGAGMGSLTLRLTGTSA
jgi:hypothetical protein